MVLHFHQNPLNALGIIRLNCKHLLIVEYEPLFIQSVISEYRGL